MPVLFIYGTLKREDCRHDAIAQETFLGEARTLPIYELIDLGEYPGLIEVGPSGLSIEGELWDVSTTCLSKLDVIECLDEGLYERRSIQLLDANDLQAESYFYLLNTVGYPRCGTNWKRKSSTRATD